MLGFLRRSRPQSAQGGMLGSQSGGSSTQTQVPQNDESNQAALDELEEKEFEPRFGVDESFQPTGYTSLYENNRDRLDGMEADLEGRGSSVDHVLKNWAENQERYRALSEQVDLPPELIAALHFRESSSRFDRYLHNGDPLGKKTTHVPVGVGPFFTWEESANDVLSDSYRTNIQKHLGLTADSTDLASIATYAELYNGTGYSKRGLSSPYAFAGTSAQDPGMYVADGKFDPNVKDQRLGVVPIVQLLAGDIDANGAVPEPFELGERVLNKGERGADVKELQQLLNDAGANLAIDGDFGPITEEAVRQFQQAAGIKVDGVVGAETLDRLREGIVTNDEEMDESGPSWELIEEELTTEEEPLEAGPLSCEIGNEMLREGSRGLAVVSLQRTLLNLGYSIVVDGVFGRQTLHVVRVFQKAFGLIVDGLVGPQTVSALESASVGGEETADVASEADRSNLVSRMGVSLLSVGSKGAPVMALQQALSSQGYSIVVDGDFGPQTRRVVETYQRQRGLIVDGVVGPQTRGALLV